MLKKCLAAGCMTLLILTAGCGKNAAVVTKDDMNVGNTTGNISNYGYSAIDGEYIYYLDTDDGRTIHRVKTDGSEESRLNGVKSDYINVLGGYVYFQNRDDNNSIYRIKTDGSEPKQLNTYKCIWRVHILY